MSARQARPGQDRGVLRGRRRECAALDGVLEEVRAGRSAVMVLRGEAGIGMTALLDYAVERAAGCRVERAVGIQSEMELAFAGLHQLCAPLLNRLDRLPGPQREALRAAFGIRAGGAPDRFLVGLAVLSLLSEVSHERPVVCVVDDVQWLDRASAQVLAFVGRRLPAAAVGLVVAARKPDGREFRELPGLMVEGLSDADARELLASVIQAPLDELVRDRIVAEAHGNPLALLELPRGLSPSELAGGFGLPDSVSLSGRIEECFRRQLERLPGETRRLLLLAAAEPLGEPMLLLRAAELLGIRIDAAAPAQVAGLLDVGARVRFRHPLVRSAVYGAASSADRQSAHRALAEVTDAKLDPDRRAWHRAHAAAGPDADVADELERSAVRAQQRGGLAAAAAFLEHAAALTPSHARRAERALAAAQAKHQAGAPEAALELLAAARAGPLEESQAARLQRLHGQIELDLGPRGDAPALLLSAARRLAPIDRRLARETHLEALWAAILAGRLGSGGQILQAARAARAAPLAPHRPRAVDLLLDALATRFTEGYAASVPMLGSALEAYGAELDLRWGWLACRIAMEAWDDESLHALAASQVQLARDSGALAWLPMALNVLASLEVYAGGFSAAEALIRESDAITHATGNRRVPYASLVLAGWRGREAHASNLLEMCAQDANARGEGLALTQVEYATAVLHNGLGGYREALDAAQRACEQDEAVCFFWVLPELVEAAARSGDRALATTALEQLLDRARAAGTESAAGIAARSRALVSEGQPADDLYREAIERLGRCRAAPQLARAHLLYGEWLRRERRRSDAREQLRTAHRMLAAIGAEAFARRAARELLASGETARKRTVETISQLTAQETRIALLARAGHSNPEIGAQLFISPRTVEYHLHKVYMKLNISSRNLLKHALPAEPDVTQLA